VRDTIRRARHSEQSFHTHFFHLDNAPERHRVMGHEKVFPEEKIQFARREGSSLAAVIDGVNHHEQVR
jgi:hypothetical protein